MNKNELTFEQAWSYLQYRWNLGLFNISKVAGRIGVDRSTLNSALNQSVDKSTGKPVEIAEKHYPKLIEFVQFMQIES